MQMYKIICYGKESETISEGLKNLSILVNKKNDLNFLNDFDILIIDINDINEECNIETIDDVLVIVTCFKDNLKGCLNKIEKIDFKIDIFIIYEKNIDKEKFEGISKKLYKTGINVSVFINNKKSILFYTKDIIEELEGFSENQTANGLKAFVVGFIYELIGIENLKKEYSCIFNLYDVIMTGNKMRSLEEDLGIENIKRKDIKNFYPN